MTSSEGFQTSEVESNTEKMDLPLQSWRRLNPGLEEKGPLLRIQRPPPSADPVPGGSRGHTCPRVPDGGAASRGAGPGTPSGDFFARKVH